MADSYNKKEREKKRRKRKKEKKERKEQRKAEGVKPVEFMYQDEFGNLSPTPPDPTKKSKVNIEEIEVSTPKKGKSEESSFLKTGVVKFFDEGKGYGFIIENETKDSFFVHVANLVDPIQDNDKVSFEVGSGPKGPIALNVKLI